MKKRYSKLFAYFYSGFVNGSVIFLLGGIMIIFAPHSDEFDKGKMIAVYAIWEVICVAMTILLSRSLFKNVPREDRKSVFFHVWWLGVKINFKIVLCITIILIAKGLAIDTSVNESDCYHKNWYDERSKVKVGDVECKVGRSGKYIEYGSKWIPVIRASNGDPYIEKNGEKIFLS